MSDPHEVWKRVRDAANYRFLSSPYFQWELYI